MSYQRKCCTRKTWAYSPAQLRKMAELAKRTSMHVAAKQLGVQWSTVRSACEKLGVRPGRARPCNKRAIATSLKLYRQGKSYTQIGRRVGYNREMVARWCRAAGIAQDGRLKVNKRRQVTKKLGRPAKSELRSTRSVGIT